MRVKIVKSSKIKEQNFNDIMNVKSLLSSKDFKNISISIIKQSGTNKKHRQMKCHYFAFVMAGSGEYLIDNKKYNVENGDLIIIPKGTAYKDSGNMTLLVINTPRFNPKQIEFFLCTHP